MDDASAISSLAALSVEAVVQKEVVAQEEIVSPEEAVTQKEAVTQEEVPQTIRENIIVDDAPKPVTITNESPTNATDSLVDKVLWKGTPLNNLAFESLVKQQQLVNTIRQLQRIEAVKARFIYVSTFLTNRKVRTKTPSEAPQP